MPRATICLALCISFAGGCENKLGARLDAGAVHDAGFLHPGPDAAVRDADRAPPIDDAGSPAELPDAGPVCTPTVADCSASCGPVPDGCGHALGCDPCDADIWCTPGVAMFAGAVQASVQSVMDSRPELFDPSMFRDTSSWLVVDDAGYTAAVVAACSARGLVCISDPNDDHEIRVRSPDADLAENYGIRVHATNRTWYRYQGVCATSLF